MNELFAIFLAVLCGWAFWDELKNIADGSPPAARWLDPSELTDDDLENNARETREDFTE